MHAQRIAHKHPMSAILSVVVCAMVALAFGVLVAGCGGRPAAKGTAEPPAQVVPPPPKLVDGKLWTPPEPQKYIEIPTPSPEELDAEKNDPNAMIVYSVFGLGPTDLMKITESGEASVHDYRETVYRLQLSPERMRSLLDMFDRADFFNLMDSYYYEPKEDDPPYVTRDLSYPTVKYQKGGRSKSVTTDGLDMAPPTYLEIEDTLREMVDEVREQGTVTKLPDLLVTYYLSGAVHVWTLDVDVDGNLYYGWEQPRPRMSAEDMASLREALGRVSSLGDDETFSYSIAVRNVINTTQHRAIIGIDRDFGRHQRLEAYWSADVPESMELLLVKLAEIYDKYAPVQ